MVLDESSHISTSSAGTIVVENCILSLQG